MLLYQNYLDVACEEGLEGNTLYKNITDVFIKPVVKEFIDSIECVYMVISDKGQSLAFFDTIEECQYFAKIYDLNYHAIH
jgi:hypothetical protein